MLITTHFLVHALLIAAQAAPTAEGPAATIHLHDADGDGFEDALVLASDTAPRLLHGRASGGFVDVTSTSGLPQRSDLHLALWGDVNGDGLADLLLAPRADEALLLLQTGPLVFTDATKEHGLSGLAAVAHAHWIDLDPDRRPDLHLIMLSGDRLLRQVEGGHFEEVDLGLAQPATVVPAPRTVEEVRRARGLEPASAGETTPASSTSASGGSVGGTASAPPRSQGVVAPWCAGALEDSSAPGTCLLASSVPVLGSLYPLGPELFIEASTGHVGIGTIQPSVRLDVVGGDVRTDGRLESTLAVGPPLSVASSDVVPNLNADLLDGLHASDFSQNDLGPTIGSSEIENLAVQDNHLASQAVTQGKIASGAVQLGHLAPGAVTVNSLADGSVTWSKLADASVTWSKISFGAVFPEHLAKPFAVHGAQPSDAIISVFNSSQSPVSIGILGSTDGGSLSSGVRGINPGGQADSYGVWGTTHRAYSPTAGVYGSTTGSGSGNAPGVLGRSDLVGGYGVIGEAKGTSGIGVWGQATATQGNTVGVFGITSSTVGTGIKGTVLPSTGANVGVEGSISSPLGVGVRASAANAGGRAFAAVGGNPCASVSAFEPIGVALSVVANATSSYADGIVSENYDDAGYAISGVSYAANGGIGVRGYSHQGNGVTGYSNGAGKSGVYGYTFQPSGYGVFSDGDYGGTGAKFFVQPHPEDASKQIRFVCLEGNESGTYFRGSAQLVGGRAVIEVPEEFRLVSEPDAITVQLTGRGPALLWYESADLDSVVVRGNADVAFDYFVNGIRRGFRDVQLVTENTAFVPEVPGEPYGAQYPEGLREVLVQNGILNPDYTPNEATAAALGWNLDAGLARREADLANRERLQELSERDREHLESSGLQPEGAQGGH